MIDMTSQGALVLTLEQVLALGLVLVADVVSSRETDCILIRNSVRS